MEFDEFKDDLFEGVNGKIEDEYIGTLTIRETEILGEELTAMEYEMPEYIFSTTLYVEAFYEEYCCTGIEIKELIDKVFHSIVEEAETTLKEQKEIPVQMTLDNVVPVLIPRAGNEMYLEKIPHIPFEDLEITFAFFVPKMQKQTTVLNAFLKEQKMDENTLLNIALKNSVFTENICVMPIQELIVQILGGKDNSIEGMTEEDEIPLKTKMTVVTNTFDCKGTAGILNPDTMMQVVEEFGEDIYILPSSIHECVVIGKSYGPIEAAQELVRETNQRIVSPVDKLSDQVYVFDRQSKKIKMAVRDKNIVQKGGDLSQRIR